MDTKEQASQPALQTLKEYAVITAAVLIMDIGIYVFKFPNNFSFGGVSGMAVVICRFLPFTASQINLFINLLLLLVGFAGWFCCAGAELRRQDSLRDRAFLGSSEHF